MPAPKQLPDGDTLHKMKRDGWTYQQIADHFGVTKGAVYLALRQVPGATKPRATNSDIIPWRVRRDHAHERPVEYLRMMGRIERGEKVPSDKLRRLNRWLDEMQIADAVVDYDPDYPPVHPPGTELAGQPNAASPKVGGWRYRHRDPALDLPFDRTNPRSLIRRPAS